MPRIEGQPSVPVPPEHQPLSDEALSYPESNKVSDVDRPSIRDLLDVFIANQLTRRGASAPSMYQKFLSLFPTGNEGVSDAELEAAFAYRKNPRRAFTDVKYRLNPELKTYGLRIVRFSGYRIERILQDED